MVGHEHMLDRHINQSVSGSNIRKQGSQEYDPHFADRETEFERLFSLLTMMMIIIALPEWLTNAQERLVLPGELPSWMVCAKTRSHSNSPKRNLARFQRTLQMQKMDAKRTQSPQFSVPQESWWDRRA